MAIIKHQLKAAVLSLTLLLILCTPSLHAQDISVGVSEPVELMSILAKTAGYREYCNDMAGAYTDATNEWFAPYSSHPTVRYMQEIREKYGISYDAVAAMAVRLECVGDGTVRFLDCEDDIGDKRWKNIPLDSFLVRLNQFYTDTRFHAFYLRHAPLFSRIVGKFREDVLKGFDPSWYSSFYGKQTESGFPIVIGVSNGGGNYGAHRQLRGRQRENFAIIGCYIEKGDSVPDYSYYLPTLIHEFNHSFANGLISSADSLQAARVGNVLYRMSALAMRRQAYGNGETVLNESLVRAAVIIYLSDHRSVHPTPEEALADEIACGFGWMPELVTALQKYRKSRKKYPNLTSYAPELLKTLSGYVDRESRRIGRPLGAKDMFHTEEASVK